MEEHAEKLAKQLDALRCLSKAGQAAQIDELQRRVRELSARRGGVQMTLQTIGLCVTRAEQSAKAAQKHQSRLDAFWAGEHDAERQAKKLEVELAAARRTCAEQRAQLDEQHAELERLRAIAEPQASAFKAGNHFNAAVDLAIVQVRAV